VAVINGISSKWAQRVVYLSFLLLFFTIPHTLEDFATGEPAEAGIPAPLLALVISIIFSLQALGLFWLGQKRRWGLVVHVGIGLFWPIASGLAQLPTILSETSYRSGAISIFYVSGMIVVGILLSLSSIISLRIGLKTSARP
jgi:hypothetical protein